MQSRTTKPIFLSIAFDIRHIAACVSVFADTLSIKGTVVENGSTPLSQVIVFVKGQNLFDTTDAQGRFEFKKFAVATRQSTPKAGIVSGVAIENGILRYSIGSTQEIDVGVFAPNGMRVAVIDHGKKIRGTYHNDIAHNSALKGISSGL